MSDTVTIKDYIDGRLSDLKDSIDNARDSMNTRLEGMNEFRDSLRDQAQRFATREQVEALSIQVQELRVARGLDTGRGAGLNAGWGYIIGAVGLVVGLITIAFAMR